MRDYRCISVEEFVAESIGMKMRWLARGLRRWDKYNEIQEWVGSITSLWELLQKIRRETAAPSQRLEKYKLQLPKRNLSATSPTKHKARIPGRIGDGEENTNSNSTNLNLATTRKRTASQLGLSEDPKDTTEEESEQKKNYWGLKNTEETFTIKKPEGLTEVELDDQNKTETMGTMELDEFPGFELSTDKAEDQVIDGGLVSENESERWETGLGVGKKKLWEAIEEKIRDKTNPTKIK